MAKPEKGCPFCGNDRLNIWGEGGSLGQSCWIVCEECGAQGPRTHRIRGEDDQPFEDRAMAGWDERVGDDFWEGAETAALPDDHPLFD